MSSSFSRTPMSQFNATDRESKLRMMEAQTFNGERTTTLQTLVKNYERRIQRMKEERKSMEDLTESELKILDRLGITSQNMYIPPKHEEKNC